VLVQAALMARLQLESLFLRGHSSSRSRTGKDPFNSYVQSNKDATSYEKVRSAALLSFATSEG
jgi:hypothetical protein